MIKGKKILALTLAVSAVFGASSAVLADEAGMYSLYEARLIADTAELPFKDVPKSHKFYDEIATVYLAGIMEGVSSTEFAPESNLSRAMLVTSLYRYHGEEKSAKSPFTDVPEGQYYTDAVNWAYETGIINGISETEFGPDENISREQLAAVLYRYAQKIRNIDVRIDIHETNTLDHDDILSISEYASPAVHFCLAGNILEEREAGKIAPQADATRAEIAAAIVRMENEINKFSMVQEAYSFAGVTEYTSQDNVLKAFNNILKMENDDIILETVITDDSDMSFFATGHTGDGIKMIYKIMYEPDGFGTVDGVCFFVNASSAESIDKMDETNTSVYVIDPINKRVVYQLTSSDAEIKLAEDVMIATDSEKITDAVRKVIAVYDDKLLVNTDATVNYDDKVGEVLIRVSAKNPEGDNIWFTIGYCQSNKSSLAIKNVKDLKFPYFVVTQSFADTIDDIDESNSSEFVVDYVNNVVIPVAN